MLSFRPSARIVLLAGLPLSAAIAARWPSSPLFALCTALTGTTALAAHYARKVQIKQSEVEAAQWIIDQMLQEQWLMIAETDRQLRFCKEKAEILKVAGNIATDMVTDYFAVYLKRDPTAFELAHEAAMFAPSGQCIRKTASEALISLARRAGAVQLTEVTPELIRSLGLDSSRLDPLQQDDPIHCVTVAPLLSEGELSGFGVFVNTVKRSQASNTPLLEAFMGRIASALEMAELHARLMSRADSAQEMINIISHDIRNPISVITLQLSYLDRTLCPEAGNPLLDRSLKHMRKATEQVNRLLNHLLEIARLESQGLNIELRPESILPIVREAVETLRPVADQSQIALVVQHMDFDLIVPLNRDSFLQILLNLLGNAVKFSPVGGVVRLTIESGASCARIIVADSGPGIQQEHIPKIFDRFWQATHQRKGSAGLGLAIVKKMVEAHHGSISVESIPGMGSTFTVELPLRKPN